MTMKSCHSNTSNRKSLIVEREQKRKKGSIRYGERLACRTSQGSAFLQSLENRKRNLPNTENQGRSTEKKLVHTAELLTSLRNIILTGVVETILPSGFISVPNKVADNTIGYISIQTQPLLLDGTTRIQGA